MAIYKSSNCSPQLSEIDFTKNNIFSCVVNTSGEPVKAYKLKIMSESGDETYYDPAAVDLLVPVQNKEVLEMKLAAQATSSNLTNGKNYSWGVRTYNAPINSAAQPNTLVAEGYIVGSTKYVIWSKISKDKTSILEQLKYDRYIEFTDINPDYMMKGAKDDVYPPLPTENYTERRKIDWVDKGLGIDENIVKIETTEPFTYNYKNGVRYNIYLCSDQHTVKSVYADPNGNINISNMIMIYNTLEDAQLARERGNNPSNFTVPQADCMKWADDREGSGARKIGGYSSDTGEIRILDSFKIAPVNGQYYRLFEYDSIEKTYKAIDDAITETGGDPLAGHRIGGNPIVYTSFRVLSNVWSSEDSGIKRLFIQPNINILSDDTNPDEIVFENGARIDIKKQTREINGEIVDITFNKLDNTQWMIEGTWELNHNQGYFGTIPEWPIPQTDYKIYTDFSDTTPYNIFYARKEPNIILQYRNAWQEIIQGIYKANENAFYDATNTWAYVPSALYLYYDVPNNKYYNYNTATQRYEQNNNVWSIIENDKTKYKDFREVEFRCLWKEEESILSNNMLDPQIKSYQFSLYAEDEDYSTLTLIAQSDEYYNVNPTWTFRGLDGTTTDTYNRNNPHHYFIQIKIIDEYDKEYILEEGFYIFYVTDKSPMPISVVLDCDEQALDVEVNSPAYATTIDSGSLETVTEDDLDIESAQVKIPSGKTLNYAKLSTDEIALIFPATFAMLTQFQITSDFVENIPIATNGSSGLPLLEVVHKLYNNFVKKGTPYYSRIIPEYKIYYSNPSLTNVAGELLFDTPCVLVNNTYSTIEVDNTTYYVASIKVGNTPTNITENITQIDNNCDVIKIDDTEYYIRHNAVNRPLLEKFTVKLSSFAPFYVNSDNEIRLNNDRYKIRIYRDSNTTPLNCFTVNGRLQNYFNIIHPEDDGTLPSMTINYALQSLIDSNSNYVEVQTLGNPDEYDMDKRYILYNAVLQDEYVYDAGIYRISEQFDGKKIWVLAEENEYVFIENTNQVYPGDTTTYDDLKVPSSARDGSSNKGKTKFNYIVDPSDDSIALDNVWLDSSLTTPNYEKILYKKFVNLFLKVILNPDGTEDVSCEIAIESKGA